VHPVEVLLTPLGWAFRNRHADESTSISNHPGLASTTRITLSSASFGDGEVIPAKHCGKFIGDDISPALGWGALPAETRDLILVIEDLNSPGTVPRIHTIAAFAPTTDGLAEGALTPDAPGIRFLPGRRGPGKYAGPRPLPGHGTHHYRFHLYALDDHVDLSTVPGIEHLPAVVEGHVLASGTLSGIRTS
jgi:phosphatidylethanolamine-binding protein (PEBP) family uncharacterized protein